MHLAFKLDELSTLRIQSQAGSWFVHVTTETEVTCAHGEEFTITIDYRREMTHDDGDNVLDAFESALRASVAQTEEQKMQATEGVRQLMALLTDEATYFQFTDPCTLP